MTPVITPTTSYSRMALLCDLHKVIGMLLCLQHQIQAMRDAQAAVRHLEAHRHV